jgi:hypothetical protein
MIADIAAVLLAATLTSSELDAYNDQRAAGLRILQRTIDAHERQRELEKLQHWIVEHYIEHLEQRVKNLENRVGKLNNGRNGNRKRRR